MKNIERGIMELIRMIDSKIAWNREKIEIYKEKIQYHENEIKRLGGSDEN